MAALFDLPDLPGDRKAYSVKQRPKSNKNLIVITRIIFVSTALYRSIFHRSVFYV